MRKAVLRIGALLIASLSLHAAFAAADTPRELKWAELMPAPEPLSALKPKAFFSGSTAPTPDGPPPPPLAEGKFMSIKRRQPGGDMPPRVVTELNGKR